MTSDPYKVLGVSHTSSSDEIKEAYRRLAKAYHPDLNPNDKHAAYKFKQISSAFSLLNTPRNRALFDARRINTNRFKKFNLYNLNKNNSYRKVRNCKTGDIQTGYIDPHMLGKLYDTMPKQNQTPKAKPETPSVFYHEIEFLESIHGATHNIKIPTGLNVDVIIPAGIENGQVLRLKGQGMPDIHTGRPGDFLITIHIKPHPQFRREGKNIHMNLPVSVHQAVLGDNTYIDTPNGKIILRIPEGSNSNTLLRLKGRGIKQKARNGDLIVKLIVMLPDKPDNELKRFVKQWKAYDMRPCK